MSEDRAGRGIIIFRHVQVAAADAGIPDLQHDAPGAGGGISHALDRQWPARTVKDRRTHQTAARSITVTGSEPSHVRVAAIPAFINSRVVGLSMNSNIMPR